MNMINENIPGLAPRDIPSMRDHVSAEEWALRVDLAVAYRLVAHFRMDDLIYNHISVRVPGPDEHFLINPYGLSYEEMTASSLIRIDLDGNIIGSADAGYGVNRAGFVIHSCIHRARPDVGCVIHTHTPAGMAVSALECGLLPLTQTSMFFGHVAMHDYEGVAVDMGEQERLVKDLGDATGMILRNHGLLTVGPTIAEAFTAMYWLERGCQAQAMAMACNTPLRQPPPEVVQLTNLLYKPETRRRFGLLEWPALVRMMERRDPSFKL